MGTHGAMGGHSTVTVVRSREAIEGSEHQRVILHPCDGQVVRVVDTAELLMWDGGKWVDVNQTDTRTVAEIMGWRAEVHPTPDPIFMCWHKPNGEVTTDDPTVDDMLAWLRTVVVFTPDELRRRDERIIRRAVYSNFPSYMCDEIAPEWIDSLIESVDNA